MRTTVKSCHLSAAQFASRELGVEWLRGRSSALLEVPSDLVPETLNVLLNPLHPDAAKLAIAEARSYPFHSRLKL